MEDTYKEDYIVVPNGYILREIVDNVFGDYGFRRVSNLDFTAELSKSINNITALDKLNCTVKTVISNKINDGTIKFKEAEDETVAVNDFTKRLVDEILEFSKKYKERFLNNNNDVKLNKDGKLTTLSVAESILSSNKSVRGNNKRREDVISKIYSISRWSLISGVEMYNESNNLEWASNCAADILLKENVVKNSLVDFLDLHKSAAIAFSKAIKPVSEGKTIREGVDEFCDILLPSHYMMDLENCSDDTKVIWNNIITNNDKFVDARPVCDKSLVTDLVESIVTGENTTETPVIKDYITTEVTEKLPNYTLGDVPTEMRRSPSFVDLLNSQKKFLYFDDVSLNREAMEYIISKFNLCITIPDGIIDVCSDMREIGKMIGKVPASVYAYILIGMLEFMFMEGVLECHEENFDIKYLHNNISSEVIAFITDRIK